mmetsp:Transcript_9730/g.15615  ORF Transcript_9730/g.15615 Transcript_9730/m.15615 type:complete len:128 (-) Transcript_9730:637-1020(-)
MEATTNPRLNPSSSTNPTAPWHLFLATLASLCSHYGVSSNPPTLFPPTSTEQRLSHLSTLDKAIYRPRFYNLAPSSYICMSHIRTSTVGCLIYLHCTFTKKRDVNGEGTVGMLGEPHDTWRFRSGSI